MGFDNTVLIGIDIGNTTIGIGVFSEPTKRQLLCIEKIPTHPIERQSTYRKVIGNILKYCSKKANKKSSNYESIISSVVPILNPYIVEVLKELNVRSSIMVSHKTTACLSLNIKKKSGIGADRISNAVGAFFYHKKPVAAIDCGTATTITVVDKDNAIVGGAILPGIRLMQSSLYVRTAKLPDIVPIRPKSFLGRDTASSIQSGVINGTVGALDNIIAGIEQELGYDLNIILTGGYSKLISPLLKIHHILKPNLIFEGMRLIYLHENKKHCRAC